MIIIAGSPLNISEISGKYDSGSAEMQIVKTMLSSLEHYIYKNLYELEFELDFRREIINSAIALSNSGMLFSSFDNSKCNPEYWIRTGEGGFILKENISPESAIADIFSNGEQYATECSTAVMIIYYKSLLEVFGNEYFNKKFTEISLYDWDIAEPLLMESGIPKKVQDILPGDRGYFENPDFEPKTPEWQGENVIVLLDGIYYAHGIGVTTADKIIQALNSRRKLASDRPAYLMDSAARPDFIKLANLNHKPAQPVSPLVWKPFPTPLLKV